MVWGIVGLVGIALMGFWPLYDRVSARKANVHTDAAVPQQENWVPARKQTAWVCPVCGRMHGTGNGKESTDAGDRCPFEEGDYFAVSEDNKPERTYTNTGAHFELSYMSWQYDGMVYITYTPNDHHAVLNEKYGATYVSAYYSTRYCSIEDWHPDTMNAEIYQDIWALRQKVLQSAYESGGEYVIGLDRILDMSVTKNPACARTGYIIWQGKQGIYVTGIRTDATADIFNYDRLSRSGAIHRFDKAYTRRLCSTLDELRAMPHGRIDAAAYGAYMDGAR